MKLTGMLAAVSASSFFFAACASEPEGPVVPAPPCVEVSQFESTLITPEVIKFVGKVAIRNQMRGPLEVQQVDYGADLHDTPLFSETFAELQPLRSRGTLTVTLPFQVAMQDVANQVEDVLAEEGVRVTFRGTVVPVGFEPIAFRATKVIPVPRVPTIALDGVRGNPLDSEFTVFLRVANPNLFPLTFGSVETFLQLNGKRYDLLRTESFEHVPAGGCGRVALTMRHARGKGLGMVVNVLKNQSVDFVVGGTLSCGTPHGVFCLPVQVGSSPAAPPGR